MNDFRLYTVAGGMYTIDASIMVFSLGGLNLDEIDVVDKKKYIDEKVEAVVKFIRNKAGWYGSDIFVFTGNISSDFELSKYFYNSYLKYEGLPPSVAVLGDKEFSTFSTEDDCVDAYRKFFDKTDIVFLENGIIEPYEDKVVLVGGSCRSTNWTRVHDIACEMSDKCGLRVLCVTGREMERRNKSVAYKSNNTGSILRSRLHPYKRKLFKEGVHEIKLNDMKQYFIDIYEKIDWEEEFERVIEENKLYVIRQQGFVGFFVETEVNGDKRYSICNGSKLEPIDGNIGSIERAFLGVVNYYLSVTEDYARGLVILADWIRGFGGMGIIHGCTIDINSTCHRK